MLATIMTFRKDLLQSESCVINPNRPLSIKVYPNPASRSVTVDFVTNRKGRVEIELVDVAGKLILKTQAASEIGNNQFPINISKIAEGAYFLKMTDGQTVSVQRLVIVK